MNTWKQVSDMLSNWISQKLKPTDIVVKLANACIGWAYVFGARGEYCTPANRRRFYNSKGKETIKSKCKNFEGSGSCSGCKWYPKGTTRFFDCRGFTYWLFLQIGIKIIGAGATSQFDNNSNWSEKGLIKDMPRDKVCCVFRWDGKSMAHTLLYDGNGHYIHCSGEVKKCDMNKYAATHYAIPKGLYDNQEVVIVLTKAIVKGGSLNLRSSKSTSSTRLTTIPNGSKIDVVEKGTDWCKVTYGLNTGYVMTKYLEFESGSEDTTVSITLSREHALALYEALKLSLNK